MLNLRKAIKVGEVVVVVHRDFYFVNKFFLISFLLRWISIITIFIK